MKAGLEDSGLGEAQTGELLRILALVAKPEETDHKRTKQQEEASGDNEQPPGEVIHFIASLR